DLTVWKGAPTSSVDAPSVRLSDERSPRSPGCVPLRAGRLAFDAAGSRRIQEALADQCRPVLEVTGVSDMKRVQGVPLRRERRDHFVCAEVLAAAELDAGAQLARPDREVVVRRAAGCQRRLRVETRGAAVRVQRLLDLLACAQRFAVRLIAAIEAEGLGVL